MKTINLTTLISIIAFIAITFFSNIILAQKRNPVTPVEDTKEEPVDLTGINTRKYLVEVYLIQRGPLFSPSLLPYRDTIVSDKYPKAIEEIEKLLILPQFISNRRYFLCKDCIFNVYPIK